MRALILVATAALALSACNNAGDAEENAAVNEALATENVVTDNLAVDANAINATDNATANAVVEDLTTNNADTNLANGM
ncbi:MAG TPA: hypothetical protein VFO42_09590 [Sphingomicrobium sp.]|nr:hypothetical protein [Sphingomicrobium sp.]